MKTKYHSEVEINENDIWQFENGLPGFPEEKEFCILPLQEDKGFFILQSTKTPEIAFVISNPFSFVPNYEFKIDEQTLEQLELQSKEDLQVLTILTVQDPFEKTTANLLAPLLFNVKNKKAKQMIINGSNYVTKHPLFYIKGGK